MPVKKIEKTLFQTSDGEDWSEKHIALTCELSLTVDQSLRSKKPPDQAFVNEMFSLLKEIAKDQGLALPTQEWATQSPDFCCEIVNLE